MQFEPITLGHQKAYLEKLAQTPEVGSSYGFINILGWGAGYDLQWAWDDANGLVWLKQTKPYEAYWAPVGDWTKVDWDKVFEEHQLQNAKFIRVPETLANIWANCTAFVTEEDAPRGRWEYVYDAQKLRDLTGNDLHKKKNLVNKFDKTYEAIYYDSRDVDLDRCWRKMVTDMQVKWCMWRDYENDELLQMENNAINIVLDAWDELENVYGGALMVDDQIVAYTIGEALTDDMIIIRFEKADVEYKGVYQAINRKFLQNSAQSFTIVNREEDVDDLGLRKAKLSYHPEYMIKKYNIIMKKAD